MIAHLDEAFSDVFKLEVSPVEGQSLLQKIRKGELGKVKKEIKKFLVQKL